MAIDSPVVEFADWSMRTIAGIFCRLHERVIAEFELDKANGVFPDCQFASREQSAR